MTIPTKRVIASHCTRVGATEKQAKAWSSFLHGLDWNLIKPLVQAAKFTNVHPALAAGNVIRTTRDDTVKAALTQHLEAKAAKQEPTCPCSNPEGWDACPVHRDGAPPHHLGAHPSPTAGTHTTRETAPCHGHHTAPATGTARPGSRCSSTTAPPATYADTTAPTPQTTSSPSVSTRTSQSTHT